MRRRFGIARSVAPQECRARVGRHGEIEIAVAIEVSIGCTTTHDRPTENTTELLADFHKAPVRIVAIEQRPLGVANPWLHPVDAVVQVSVDRQQIEPAVQVVFEKEQRERQCQQTRASDL